MFPHHVKLLRYLQGFKHIHTKCTLIRSICYGFKIEDHIVIMYLRATFGMELEEVLQEIHGVI